MIVFAMAFLFLSNLLLPHLYCPKAVKSSSEVVGSSWVSKKFSTFQNIAVLTEPESASVRPQTRLLIKTELTSPAAGTKASKQIVTKRIKHI